MNRRSLTLAAGALALALSACSQEPEAEADVDATASADGMQNPVAADMDAKVMAALDQCMAVEPSCGMGTPAGYLVFPDVTEVALGVGGAGGLGEATVRRLHGAGAKVVIADMADDKGRALESELGVRYVQTDATSEESVNAAIAEAQALAPLRISVDTHGGPASGKGCIKGELSAPETALRLDGSPGPRGDSRGPDRYFYAPRRSGKASAVAPDPERHSLAHLPVGDAGAGPGSRSVPG